MDVVEPDFELRCEIDASPSLVVETLSDLHKLAPLHPLIVSINDVVEESRKRSIPVDDESESSSTRHYQVIDRIPMGLFKMKITYDAALRVTSAGEVHGYAWQSPGIHLKTIYTVVERADGGALVCERCYVHAGAILRWVTISQARKAHQSMLHGLKGMLEGEEDTSRASQ